MNDIKDIIYNCRKATFLIEKKQLTSLTLRERMELKLHLAGCSVCRRFQEQSHFITKQVRGLFHSPADPGNLDDRFKQELQQRIDEELNKS